MMRRTTSSYDWGRPVPIPAWRDARFWASQLGWALTVAIVVHVAIARSGG